jgi:MFS family permease
VTGGLLDLPSFTKYFPSIDTENPTSSNASTYQGIAVASYNLGCFLGAVLTIFIGNPLGRRKTIFFGSIVMTIGAILQCTSFQLPQLIVGRIVTGIGNGMNTSTVPTWQSETSPSHQRGKLVMIEGMLITGGICLSYWINYGFAWYGEHEVAWVRDGNFLQPFSNTDFSQRFPLAFQLVFTLVIMAMILNLPESPRWLVLRNRNDEALEVLTYLNDKPSDDPAIINEFEEVKATVAEMNKGSFRTLFEMTEYREFHRVVLAYVNQM